MVRPDEAGIHAMPAKVRCYVIWRTLQIGVHPYGQGMTSSFPTEAEAVPARLGLLACSPACAENPSVQVRGLAPAALGSGLRGSVRRGNGHSDAVVAA